jgi:hypothetical protein
MIDIGDMYKQRLTQLKGHSSFYENLPFNTGDFLLIANYKLIGNYRQLINGLQSGRCDETCLNEYAHKRKALHEELLFQLDKALSLSSLTEKETEQLQTYKILHETLLQEITP